MTPFTVRGVPRGIARDAWWMAADATSGIGANPPKPKDRIGTAPVVALLGLIALADVMLWQVVPGIGLPLFLLSVAFGAHALCFAQVPARKGIVAWAVLGLSLVPMIDLVQSLSVFFGLLGLLGFVGIMTGQSGRAAIWAALRFPFLGAVVTFVDASTLATQPRPVQSAALLSSLRDWIIPATLGLIFAALMIVANPVIDQWLSALLADRSVPLPSGAQVLFWILMIPLIWPFLRLTGLRGRLLRPARAVRAFGQVWFLTGRSVLRALVVFNLIFALQSVTDLTILWGGAALPEGMTYAQYAHRGAYPLLFAALLAGGFALLMQPFMQGRPVLRVLMLLWIGQTALLVASSMLRLDLYIEAYSLTRMRFAAFVWMAVIGGGLLLMMWQVLRGFGPAWLMMRATELALVTLYVCSLVNIDGFVARHNLNDRFAAMDAMYVCNLGDGAAPAIAAYDARHPWSLCGGSYGIGPQVSQPQDWREWGYRNARLRSNLAKIEGADL